MQVASRLVELNLQIRSVFRGPLPSSGEQPENSDSEADISKPVRNSGAFAEPAATQPRPRVAVEPAKEPVSPPAPPIEIAHQPVELQDLEEGVPDEEMEPDETPLGFSQMLSELFKQGLGTDNAMIFQDKLFQDRMLVQKVLLSGQSSLNWVVLWTSTTTLTPRLRTNVAKSVQRRGRPELWQGMFLVLTLLHVFSHMGQSTNT